MSGENVATFRRTVDAFNDGDLEAVASVLDADSEWDWSRSIGPDKAVYRGPEEIVGFWEEFTSGFEDVRITIEQVIGTGDRLVAAVLSVMRGRDGIEVEARNAWLITLAEGKLRRLEMFQTHTEALQAAGLSE
jgi:ketosteroid isomerase-like protein